MVMASAFFGIGKVDPSKCEDEPRILQVDGTTDYCKEMK